MPKAWLRRAGVLLALALPLATAGCGLVAAAAIAAIQDGLDGGDDGDGGGGPPDLRPKVAVVHALPDAAHASDVIDRLTATGAFAAVGDLDASLATPAGVQLAAYDAVLVVADGVWHDAVALGDVLAAYADGGGGVVTATYARPGEALGGAWDAGDYDAILATGVVSGDGPVEWVADLPVHPIVAGLAMTGSGTGSDRPEVATAAPGAVLVASWDTGQPLVAVHLAATGARLAGLGFHVVSDAVDPSFVDDASDATAIVSRSLLWVAYDL